MVDFDDGRHWPVVAEFFVTILAVFVMLYAGSRQKDPELIQKVEAIQKALERDKAEGLIQEFKADDREVTLVYADHELGFPDCGWDIGEGVAPRIRAHMERFSDVEQYINLLQIEGHADSRRPRTCFRLRFRTNFELSQTRAMSVFAALLDKPIEELDTVTDSTAVGATSSSAPVPLPSNLVGRLAARKQVLIAGFGATRLVEGAPPEDRRHRRVEIRVTFTDRVTR